MQALDNAFSPAFIIAQHMSDEFIPSFVNQLQQYSDLTVSPACDNARIQSGQIYVCSLMTKLIHNREGLKFSQRLDKTQRFNPDIDYLFESAAVVAKTKPTLGVILTGVGDDGARGCKALHDAGGQCIVESESTAIVYGMPMQAKRLVPGVSVQDLPAITHSIRQFG